MLTDGNSDGFALDRLETPTPEQGLAAIKVEGTNCWITKDADNSLGFVMVGVHQPTMVPRLSNIDFRFSV